MAERKKKTAYVLCRGGSPLKDGIDRSALPRDCGAILGLFPDGINICRYGCLGGGSCTAACHLGAIKLEGSGPPSVDADRCVGCGLCSRACPQGIIDIINREYFIRPKCSSRDYGKAAMEACSSSCITCGMCVRSCPAGAISLEEGRPVIDPDICLGCGMCAVKCPRGVIRDTRGVITAE